MKFVINRDHFTHGLAAVLNVVSSKATMPILSNVLIQAEKDSIILTTTNLDMGVRCRIRATVKEEGAIALPVRRLATIIRELSNIEVTVESKDTGAVKVSSGGSVFRISGLPAVEFPPIPEPAKSDRTITLQQSELLEMLKSVAYAQSSDETRYILNGVMMSIEAGKLTVVATDGRRLAFNRKDAKTHSDETGKIILPAKAVAEVSRMLGYGQTLTLSISERRASFNLAIDDESEGLVKSIFLSSKVVEGTYPNFNSVIPKESKISLKINRSDFLDAITRAALVCSEKSNSLKVSFTKGQLEITAQSPDFGEARELLPIQYEGPEAQICFNPQFVVDPLRVLTEDEITFEMTNDASPAVIKNRESFLCVVMPVRLS